MNIRADSGSSGSIGGQYSSLWADYRPEGISYITNGTYRAKGDHMRRGLMSAEQAMSVQREAESLMAEQRG